MTDVKTPEMCGASHSTMPGVTCQKWGKCQIDSHAAAVGIPPHQHWIEWGRDYRALLPKAPAGITAHQGWQPAGTEKP